MLVAEHRWVPAMELAVQPAERPESGCEALELSFRTLELT